MRVFVADERFDEIREKLSEFGKIMVIEKAEGGEEGDEVRFSDGTAVMRIRTNLRDLLDFLSCSYDFVALKGFGEDEVASLGISPNPVETIEDAMGAEEWISLKALVDRIKESPDRPKCGAIGVFIGFVRELSGRKRVVRLEYEKYGDVFDRVLREIEDELRGHGGVADVKIHHRVGSLEPGEDIVYVVVMGEHRKDIWEPLIQSMEIVKKRLPVWKKEVYEDGEEWVHDMRHVR